MSKLVLYTDAFWISPYVFSCFVALREKGLDFETRAVSLGDKAQLAPGYREHTITARVPALEHGDFWLAESSAIVEYVDEAFPDGTRLLPKDLHERARARQVLGWIRSDVAKVREERSTHTMFYKRADAPLSPEGEEAAAKVVSVASSLVHDGRASIAASGFSIADADLAFMLMRLILNGHAVPARVRAYADAIWARPSVHEFVSHTRPPYVPY